MELEEFLHNGEIWEHPSGIQAITQWIDRDSWILLGTPGAAIHGGTCMLEISGEDGMIIHTHAQIVNRLKKNNWKKTARILVVR